jgi:hypothetical protein
MGGNSRSKQGLKGGVGEDFRLTPFQLQERGIG